MTTLNQNTKTAKNIEFELADIAQVEIITRFESGYMVTMRVQDFAYGRHTIDGKVKTHSVQLTFKSAVDARKFAKNRKTGYTMQDIEIALADDDYTLFYQWANSVSEEQSLNTKEALNERAYEWLCYQLAVIEWENECRKVYRAKEPDYTR